MPKANYKPVPLNVASIQPQGVPMRIGTNLNTSYWGLVAMEGLARYSATGSLLTSAAIVVWLTANVDAHATIGTADYITFTDDQARYAVTVPTYKTITMRVYS